MQESTQQNLPTVMKQPISALLIANPTSGSYVQRAQQVEEAVASLRLHGWQVELKLTQAQGDAGKLAQIAVNEHIDLVVAVGGDGTINEIIQALAGSETSLGVLPSGTVNVWARETGIPLDYAGACDVLLNGCTRTIDLGQINERYFLLMVGIGFDGEVTHAVEQKPAKRLGVLGYLLIGTWLGLGYRGFRAFLEINTSIMNVNALQIVVGNTQLYAGAIEYTWQAQCDDGLLDMCIVRKQNMFRRPAVLIDFLLRRPQRRQWVRYETGTVVKLHTRQPVAIQIDGEPAGYTARGLPSTTFRVIPGALKVRVPRTTQGSLFSNTLAMSSSQEDV